MSTASVFVLLLYTGCRVIIVLEMVQLCGARGRRVECRGKRLRRVRAGDKCRTD